MKTSWPKLSGKSSAAQFANSLLQNRGALLQFAHGHELAGAMRLADVARSDHDRFAAEQLHLRAFSAESDRGGFAACGVFEQLDEPRIDGRFEARISAISVDFANEIGIGALLFLNGCAQEMQNSCGRLGGNRTPFEREATLAGEHVLRSAAVNDADVERGERRIESLVLICFQLFRDLFELVDE